MSSSASFRHAMLPEDQEGSPDEIWEDDCRGCRPHDALYDAACPLHGARAMREALE